MKPGTPVSLCFNRTKESIDAIVVVRVPPDCSLKDLRRLSAPVREVLNKAEKGDALLVFNPSERQNRPRYLLRGINLIEGKPQAYYLVAEPLITESG